MFAPRQLLCGRRSFGGSVLSGLFERGGGIFQLLFEGFPGAGRLSQRRVVLRVMLSELDDGRAFREQSLAGLLKLVLRLGQPAFERGPSGRDISEVRLARGRFPREQFRQLRFALRQPLGRGDGLRGSIRSGLFERRRGVVQTSFEDVLSGRGLGQARVVLRVTLGKLRRRRRPLRRMPFVGSLTFRLRLCQPRFERLARGGFLSEPPLELRFAPRQLIGCGGALCRSILPRLIELRLDVAQPPFENVPGGRGLREARFMLCLALGELLRCGSLLRRVPLLIVRALCFRIRQSCFGRLARGHFPTEPLLEIRFAPR